MSGEGRADTSGTEEAGLCRGRLASQPMVVDMVGLVSGTPHLEKQGKPWNTNINEISTDEE